jgi:hypothetical protein
MFNGSPEDRQAIMKASEVVGQMAKYSFLSICYLGVVIGVTIKVGGKTIKIIKEHIPNLKKQERSFDVKEDDI